ncbi:uncharacterized protein NCU04729 [Neurospora crassa OR74A]|uniref:NDT80 domain-containing protein n=2 Tax=Neurospora crassa TaxID=5141 RepID=V5IN03_NEUCR|nr:uncharacterized protein NCU04729 [Neurospora crassa OR74A]ESA42121.1 hypothetical protein, variant [Neurospora crassa OR74A]CAE85551.1 related to acid phosphatase [Neurospora crassa]|eukprot:XP_011394902.1 uncharacterized protein NCU04729 [Neurospora crassa OR74A]
MASFNSIPQLPNGAPVDTADALGLNAAGQPMGMGMGMGIGDPFGFEEALLDVNADLHAGIPFTPSAYDFDNFTFEDPFSTTTSFPPLPAHSQGHSHIHIQGHGHTPYNLPSVGGGPIVGAVAAEAEAALKITTNEVDSPSDLLDNKLLGFSPPIPSGQATLVDSETGRFADFNMTAELYGMFFVAEDVFASNTPVSDQGQGLGQGQGQAQHPGARPLELTCYRRNLWQCTGQITLPRHALHCSLLLNGNEQQPGGNGAAGRQVRIKELWASITAMESIEGKPTEIISIPWKSNNPAFAAAGGQQQGQQPEESSRTATTPPKQLLDLSAGQEIDKSGNRVSIPVSWKRLQFKHATANNGRRKGLQQHYVVQINLLAKTAESGDKLIKLAEIQSGPVIVRGRSPRNFDSRRDVPLTGDRKGMLQRTNTEGSGGVGAGAGAGGNGSHDKQQTQQQQQQGMDRTEMLQRYHSLGNQPSSDWSSSTGGPTPQPFSTSPNLHQQQHPNKKLAMTSNSPGSSSRPPIPSWGSLSSDAAANNHNSGSRRKPTPLAAPNRTSHHRNTSSSAAGALPISLSLSEDEQRSPPMNRTATPGSAGAGAGDSPLYGKMGVATGGLKRDTAGKGMGFGSGSGGLTSTTHSNNNKGDSHFESGSLGQQNQYQKENVGSPIEAADLLYEYFPLSLDDWMPPVDAVYRPHVVHHTIVPPEIKAQQTNSRTKRYFAAE